MNNTLQIAAIHTRISEAQTLGFQPSWDNPFQFNWEVPDFVWVERPGPWADMKYLACFSHGEWTLTLTSGDEELAETRHATLLGALTAIHG